MSPMTRAPAISRCPTATRRCARLANGSAQERLSRNSYIITPELTAFLVYDDDPVSPRAYLYFSQDQGQSWQQNFIGYGHKANSFLSQTERGIYATFAADRTLGSDYYQTCFSSDLVNWGERPLPSYARNYTCAYWPEDGVGYYSGTTTSELVTNGDGSAQERTYSNNFFATFDGGERYSMLTFPGGGRLHDRRHLPRLTPWMRCTIRDGGCAIWWWARETTAT